MAEDYSYVGSGMLHFREYGAAAPFIEAGNCSALTFSPQTNTLSLPDHTQPGGGVRNQIERVTSVEMAYTFHDYSPQNFARALRGNATEAVAGNVADEAVVAYKGGFTPFARIPAAVTSVEPAGGGTPYEEGEDYEIRNGGIFIPADSAIPAPVSGAANLAVTYSYDAQTTIEAMVNPAKQYEVLFTGLNEARSGKAVRIRAHKVSGGLLQSMALLGEDYGAGEVTGGLQSDQTKTGIGVSKFFKVEMVN